MLWGFFFFFGMIIALVIRWLMAKIGIVHLIDPDLQRRVTWMGSGIYLIVSTVTAVQVVVVWEYILPISLIAIINGIITTLRGGIFWRQDLVL